MLEELERMRVYVFTNAYKKTMDMCTCLLTLTRRQWVRVCMYLLVLAGIFEPGHSSFLRCLID